VHHERVHETQNRVLESLRNRSDDVEAKPLPEPDRALIRADHKIELHGAEASCSRADQRVFAHRRRNTSTTRVRRRHVAAIGDVCAATAPIGMQIVGSHYPCLVFSDEHFVIAGKPECQRVGSAPVTRQRVGFPRPQGSMMLQTAFSSAGVARRMLSNVSSPPGMCALGQIRPWAAGGPTSGLTSIADSNWPSPLVSEVPPNADIALCRARRTMDAGATNGPS
jgi:hypothetical protein